MYGLIWSRARRREQLPRVAAVAPPRPQRERVLAAAVEADHILGLREVPFEREARMLAAQGERERAGGVVMVAVYAAAKSNDTNRTTCCPVTTKWSSLETALRLRFLNVDGWLDSELKSKTLLIAFVAAPPHRQRKSVYPTTTLTNERHCTIDCGGRACETRLS